MSGRSGPDQELFFRHLPHEPALVGLQASPSFTQNFFVSSIPRERGVSVQRGLFDCMGPISFVDGFISLIGA